MKKPKAKWILLFVQNMREIDAFQLTKKPRSVEYVERRVDVLDGYSDVYVDGKKVYDARDLCLTGVEDTLGMDLNVGDYILLRKE